MTPGLCLLISLEELAYFVAFFCAVLAKDCPIEDLGWAEGNQVSSLVRLKVQELGNYCSLYFFIVPAFNLHKDLFEFLAIRVSQANRK